MLTHVFNCLPPYFWLLILLINTVAYVVASPQASTASPHPRLMRSPFRGIPHLLWAQVVSNVVFGAALIGDVHRNLQPIPPPKKTANNSSLSKFSLNDSWPLTIYMWCSVLPRRNKLSFCTSGKKAYVCLPLGDKVPSLPRPPSSPLLSNIARFLSHRCLHNHFTDLHFR